MANRPYYNPRSQNVRPEWRHSWSQQFADRAPKSKPIGFIVPDAKP